MCGLAELLHRRGYCVSGSDLHEGPTVARLRSLGVEVALGHRAEHVRDAHVVVFSSAVRPSNPELKEAEARQIPIIPRAEMLAELMRMKQGVAVAGSHGKTTTTSLISHVLHAAGLDPTSVIGGRVLAANAEPTGARHGQGELLVAEADESDGSFLRLSPVIAVVTNVDPEHLDHYGDYEHLEQAFVDFANRVPFWGKAVLCLDHPGVQRILPRMTRPFTSYGFSSQVDWRAVDVEPRGWGMTFSVQRAGEALGRVLLNLPGRHNVQNALATLAVAYELEIPFARAAESLASFLGIERRFENKGEARDVRVVDDYAHHPAEIRATLAAARSVHSGRLVVVFQPHRYTRTRDLFDDFATAFHDADWLAVTDIYAAGEDKLPGVDAASLSEAIQKHGHRSARYIGELETLPAVLEREVTGGDLVLTLGAGNISQVGPQLLARLREKT